MFRKISVFLALVLVIGALSACASSGAGKPALAKEKQAELEAAWYDFELRESTWYQPGGYMHTSFCYYGSFEGYDIVLRSSNMTVVDGITIAGEKFEFGTPSTFYTFRDGKICELQKLYEQGKISADAISELAQRHKGDKEQLPAPPEALKIPFQRAYLAYENPVIWNSKEDQKRTVRYYGSYEGYDFLYYAVAVPPESQSHYSRTIAGYEFEFDCAVNLVAIQNGAVVTTKQGKYELVVIAKLQQLYEEGKISAETVAEINRVHNLYEGKK